MVRRPERQQTKQQPDETRQQIQTRGQSKEKHLSKGSPRPRQRATDRQDRTMTTQEGQIEHKLTRQDQDQQTKQDQDNKRRQGRKAGKSNNRKGRPRRNSGQTKDNPLDSNHLPKK